MNPFCQPLRNLHTHIPRERDKQTGLTSSWLPSVFPLFRRYICCGRGRLERRCVTPSVFPLLLHPPTTSAHASEFISGRHSDMPWCLEACSYIFATHQLIFI